MDSSNKIQSPLFVQQTIEHVPLSNRKLVLVHLIGGNDGLNTVIPTQQDAYYRLRPNLSIKAKNTFSIGTDYGLHLSLESLMPWFEKGFINILHNIGYPNPSRSHFKSIDVWKTASGDATKLLETGWVGRYLDAECESNLRTSFKAIELSEELSLTMKGTNKFGISFESPESLFKSLSSPVMRKNVLRYKKMSPIENPLLEFMYKTVQQGHLKMKALQKAYKNVRLPVRFPKTSIGDDLKSVAEVIQCYDETQVFYLSFGSFDTHAQQSNRHSTLLKKFSQSLSSFIDCLSKLNRMHEVCILVFSEFGRRVKENGSKGTDHGAGNVSFVVSPHLNRAGVYNELIDLEKLSDGDVGFTIDFRQIYATILEDWLETDSELILNGRFDKLPLFKRLEYVV